jgi:hypothetical protein
MAATIDKELANALKAARGGKPMQFAFLPKGSEGKLLVDKKVPPKVIADTKKETGATSVFKGRCVAEDGTLVFYVAKEPPGPLLGQLKKRLKDDAGLTCPVEIRVKADSEAESEEGEAEAPGDTTAPPISPEDRGAEWQKALAKVEPAYLQALRDHPDKVIALRAVMGFAQGKAEKEDFPGAIAALRKLVEQLAPTRAGSESKVAPGPAAQKPAGGDPAAEWKARLAEWTPAIKEALAAKGPNAAGVGKLLAQATALAKPGGDMAQALAHLAECHKLATAGAAPDGQPMAGAGRLVKQRQFMLTRWARIPAELKVSLDQYKIRIIEGQADHNPEEVSAAMEAYLDNLLAEIKDKLDDAINAGDMSVFAGQRAKVENDKLLVHLSKAPFMNGAAFREDILKAVGEIEAAMTA